MSKKMKKTNKFNNTNKVFQCVNKKYKFYMKKT